MSGDSARPAGTRDVRLDFFRGLAMLIIVVAHSPGNPWVDWIPARFGFSSAAEMFVFCSGLASAFAFGAVFSRQGFAPGLARVARRIWRLYLAQVALFVLMAAITLAAVRMVGDDKYIDMLALGPFLRDPGGAILGLLTLRYLPNFFDMLPMYIVVLAMIPAAMALAAIQPRLALGVSFAMWLAAQATGFNLSARPDGSQDWYFNPFAWQFLFFLGFGLASGWISAPALRQRLPTILAAAIVVASVPFSFRGFTAAFPALEAGRVFLAGDGLPTQLGLVRILHFLALAYLVLSLVEPWRERLARAGWARPMLAIGRQTLPVFLASIVIGWLMGIAFDLAGAGAASALAINMIGLGAAVAVAAISALFKGRPWRSPRARAEARPTAAPAMAPAE